MGIIRWKGEVMQRGSVIITEKKEEPKTQTSSDGAISRGGRRAPPRTPFRRRKVGDKVRVGNKLGIIKKIRTNGHESYLVAIRGRSQWFSEFEVG